MPLQETGMIYMTKIPLILLTLSSCSMLSYGELPGLIKDSIVGVDFDVSEEFYNSQSYSFAKIKLGKSTVAITVLASIASGHYLWLSESGEKIYTHHGRIIKTLGLTHDIDTLEARRIDSDFSYASLDPSESTQSSALMRLSNPEAIISQEYRLINRGIDVDYFNSMLYEESFTSGKLAFNGINRYWVDPKGRVIRSEQYIHPRMPVVTMEFYYK